MKVKLVMSKLVSHPEKEKKFFSHLQNLYGKQEQRGFLLLHLIFCNNLNNNATAFFNVQVLLRRSTTEVYSSLGIRQDITVSWDQITASKVCVSSLR